MGAVSFPGVRPHGNIANPGRTGPDGHMMPQARNDAKQDFFPLINHRLAVDRRKFGNAGTDDANPAPPGGDKHQCLRAVVCHRRRHSKLADIRPVVGPHRYGKRRAGVRPPRQPRPRQGDSHGRGVFEGKRPPGTLQRRQLRVVRQMQGEFVAAEVAREHGQNSAYVAVRRRRKIQRLHRKSAGGLGQIAAFRASSAALVNQGGGVQSRGRGEHPSGLRINGVGREIQRTNRGGGPGARNHRAVPVIVRNARRMQSADVMPQHGHRPRVREAAAEENYLRRIVPAQRAAGENRPARPRAPAVGVRPGGQQDADDFRKADNSRQPQGRGEFTPRGVWARAVFQQNQHGRQNRLGIRLFISVRPSAGDEPAQQLHQGGRGFFRVAPAFTVLQGLVGRALRSFPRLRRLNANCGENKGGGA